MKLATNKITFVIILMFASFIMLSINHPNPNNALQYEIMQLKTQNDQLNNKLQDIQDYLQAETHDNNCVYDDSITNEIMTLYSLQQEQLLKIPVSQPIAHQDLLWISSKYGMRKHPILKRRMMHHGIDYVAKFNTPIYATAPGVVIRVIKRKYGYGNAIVIRHSDTFKTMYAHLNKINVCKNDSVQRNQIIGTVGSTGLSTGPHLHYEILKNDETINPIGVILLFENM